ncbi:hypothetical protein AUJ66_05730 [Candidatus Desantisbacteria bacterium CG1_02_38_46]|uniref:6-phospho-3-hexuloisomerase n=3 Tax=unclassified Candidatus Desantisiibacteriota TaxID=3106372 RepID=A0A2H9PD62_9BACT|nr:MAG: hypothetical protein AUJ66_05730 [Candidatus Desantisbacteria bacterium CG1_02_38_46]PIU52012.1 MAG: 6-phospho-3-hexuloisomerase [Candidatus Desantisbacteria bacterium CG07_land_8_20_14_0_80_39_15]PIZ17367.1 MAG: 6-phospho-3-hexuloisomerase [Candidatus Desantisbacteria bacterium CG_4_10_14_0_8_um_filter_39_17]
MEIEKAIEIILDEERKVMGRVDKKIVEKFIKKILIAKRIFLAGEGRSGLIAKTFAMRLMQLGFETYVAGETITPGIGRGDLLIACSGSGETEVTFHMAEVARNYGAKVVTFTANRNSTIVNVSDLVVGVPVPFKGKFKRNGLEQIGGSLFEQGLFLMMEAVVLILMRRLKKSPHELWKRHTKLE